MFARYKSSVPVELARGNQQPQPTVGMNEAAHARVLSLEESEEEIAPEMTKNRGLAEHSSPSQT
jgi:hypothetical protein